MNNPKCKVEFIEEGHIYKVDGKEYASVTQIIGGKFFGNQAALDKGNAVDKLIYLYENQDLGEVPSWLEPYLAGWMKFKADYQDLFNEKGYVIDVKTGQKYVTYPIQTVGYKILAEENKAEGLQQILFSSKWGFCGTPDLCAVNSKGKITYRACLYLNEGGYELDTHSTNKYQDKSDENLFKSMAHAHNWRKENKLL